MCDKLNRMEDAFEDKEFLAELQNIRIQIEDILLNLLGDLQKDFYNKIKISSNLESRIKTVESFLEKIKRKEYIDNWDIEQDIKRNQELIALKFPDLIGFRINCFFLDGEEEIYNAIKNSVKYEKYREQLCLDFTVNTKQRNGHNIYKFTGIYKNSYSFEVQIKSFLHNIWGEVDHKTIYKSIDYDPKKNSKKLFTEEIFNILQASDKQLKTIFTERYTDKELTQGLFYHKSKEVLIHGDNTSNILGDYYNVFFDIFSDSNSCCKINQFVASKLINVPFEKGNLSKINRNKKIDEIKEMLVNEYIQYEIDIVYHISEIIYDFSKEEFLVFLSKHICEQIEYTDNETEKYNDAFDEEDDVELKDKFENEKEDLRNFIKKYFRRKECI